MPDESGEGRDGAAENEESEEGKADRHPEGTDQKSFMFSGCASISTASRFFMAWLK